MPYLTDSHAHIYLEEFDTDRDEVIQRAKDAGVEKIFMPNIDLSTVDRMMDVKNKYPEMCFPMMGLHPGSVGEDYTGKLEKIYALFDNGYFIAVGEIGIDLYWDKTYRKEQELAFKMQVEWARERDLPVVIHCREAFEVIFEILDEFKEEKITGVFHSFTGKKEDVKRILDFGFYVGINGIVTFKNSNLVEPVREIPTERILLETDSPFLAPVPKRGKRNESAHVRYVAEKVAEIKGLALEDLISLSSSNAMKLFKNVES